MAFSIRSSLASATRGGLVKPGAPSNIVPAWNSAAAATSTATVTFTAGSPTGLSYTVYATPNGGSATTPIEAVTSGTLISLLVNNTNYTFTVVAKRGILTNSATSTSYFSPVGQVIIQSISNVTNAGATINYTEPPGGGTYAITTTPTTITTTPTTNTTTPTTPTSNSMAIIGLTGNTSYTFTIKISNATSNNSSTSSSQLTKPDAPIIGNVTVTSTTVVSIQFTVTGTASNITAIAITSSPSITLTYTTTTRRNDLHKKEKKCK